jgi:HEAT repeat protein
VTAVARVVVAACVVSVASCSWTLPDDLPHLIQAMESSDVTTSVNATVKVWRVYGKNGLFEAIQAGGPRTRGRAAFRLQSCRDEDCEAMLVKVLRHDEDGFARKQAAMSLKVVGTERALPVLAEAQKDPDPRVAELAAEAADAVRARAHEPGK